MSGDVAVTGVDHIELFVSDRNDAEGVNRNWKRPASSRVSAWVIEMLGLVF
jgi:hypothetical protein